MGAPPSPNYIPGPEAPPSPDYIPGPEYPEYLPPADDVLPAEEQPLPVAVSPTVESPGYITDSEPEMDLEEEDRDDEESEEDSIDYPTSRGDDDANEDGDELSNNDADDEDEEESSDREEEEEEHLAPTIFAPALHSSIPAFEDSDETKPFEEGETAATPPPFGYRIAARIYVQPHILMPFRSESVVERLLDIPTPPLSLVSPTSYPLPPFLMPLPIFTLLPTSSFPLPLSIPSTSGSESIPKVDIPLRKRAHFTTPTSRYEIGKSSVHEHAQRDDAPEDGDSCSANPDPTRTTTATEPMTQEAINNLTAQRVMDALAEYEIQRNSVVNRDTSNTTGTGPRIVRPTRECTYKDYLNCGPLKFNGTEGIIGLTRWFEKTEYVSNISNCIAENQVKFASCTLIGSALTWWNSHMRVVGQEVAYAMPWKTLKQIMTAKLGNRNQGNQNQAGNGNAVARAYGVGTAGGNPNANLVTGTFLLNNHCASILFDTGADKSCVSTAFSSLININPSTLDCSYDVELADGQIVGVNTDIRGCTLNLLNRPFNIDLMPVELVCDEKIVRVPFENETLIIRCDGSNNGNQLKIISCTKTRKYLLKGYPVFLANITMKTIKDKSKEKQLEDMPIV
nr:hypothetical protein [Tanacetum cinerariifolium]